ALARLGYVVDMGLDGEERMSGFTVGLVDADETEEGIGAVAECQQEARLAHVLVVVDPRFGNLRAIEHERSRQLTILAPLPSPGAFEWGSDPRVIGHNLCSLLHILRLHYIVCKVARTMSIPHPHPQS